MTKNTSPNKSSETVQPSATPGELTEAALIPVWLLNYHVLADNDRRGLLIAVTRNEGGGYFSRERVHFRTIVTCLDKYKSGMPFVSKVLKDVFVSKSANNAGFIAVVLHALGLLATAPDAKTQHVVTGDWPAWEKAMLAETGTRIELPAEIDGEKQGNADTVPDHEEPKKTLGIPVKKPQ